MSYLPYLCLFAYSGVQQILCCIFVLFPSSCVHYHASFSGLSVYLIAPSVFSNVHLFFSINLFNERMVYSILTVCVV